MLTVEEVREKRDYLSSPIKSSVGVLVGCNQETRPVKDIQVLRLCCLQHGDNIVRFVF